MAIYPNWDRMRKFAMSVGSVVALVFLIMTVIPKASPLPQESTDAFNELVGGIREISETYGKVPPSSGGEMVNDPNRSLESQGVGHTAQEEIPQIPVRANDSVSGGAYEVLFEVDGRYDPDRFFTTFGTFADQPGFTGKFVVAKCYQLGEVTMYYLYPAWDGSQHYRLAVPTYTNSPEAAIVAVGDAEWESQMSAVTIPVHEEGQV